MKRKTNILLIVLIISSLGLILIPKSVSGSIHDIYYSFENDVFYESGQPLLNKSFNIRNQTYFTEIYDASYSFTNETIGTSGTDINFIDFTDLTSNSFIQINESQYNHDKVIEFHDESANTDSGYHIFDSDRTIDTIEFWWLTDDSTKRMDVYIGDGATIGIYLAWSNDDFYYNDGGFHVVDQGYSNIWYHHRLDFDTTTDTFDWYINGILYNGLGFVNALTKVNRLTIYYHTILTDFSYFFDGFGFSWLNNYTIGQNLIPIIETDITIKKVDRYEFALSDIDTWYESLDENPSGFNTYVVGSGDSHIVKIVSENRRVYSVCYGTSSQSGIKKENFNFHGEFINITVGIRYTERVDVLGFGLIRVYSFDNTEILQLRLDDEGDLEYYNGATYTLLYSDEIDAYTDHEFNCFINYELDLVFLNHFINGSFFRNSIFPLIVSGKEGLKAVDVGLYTLNAGTDVFIQFVEYIGVYVNGLSQANEFGYLAYDLERLAGFDGDWSLTEYNLFRIQALGNFTIGISAGNGYFEDYFYTTLINVRQYYNVETFFNLYDVEQETSYSQPFVIIYLQQDNLFENLTLINIEGVKLTEGINEYILEFSHSGVDTNESYFYVDLNNKLQFSLISNDTNTEYIQATFNISDLSSTDRAISFRGVRTNLAFGYFYVDYLVGASQVEIPIIEKTTRIILPSNKTIDNFIVLISDNDQDTILGTTTGYVSQPILLNILGIGLPIITAGLIEMMIPLLLIIVPTLLISKGFGKQGKKLIIPLFLVFSLIATATFIIPVWIFFIIAFGIGLFLFRNKEIESDL